MKKFEGLKIPFGKFKGKSYFYLDDEYEYVRWLMNNCEETIKKFPEFYDFLYNEQDVFDESPAKEYTEPIPTNGCGISSNAVMIKSFVEYREFISKLYCKDWKKSKEENIYKTFGKPLEYPFIITLRKNILNCFETLDLHKIYIKDKPSYYTYREEMY